MPRLHPGRTTRTVIPHAPRAMLLVLLAMNVSAACGERPEEGGPLFVEGCPKAGRALASRIANPDQRMEGPDAIGGEGDYLLMNARAAFIVQGVERTRSYYYYGGILIDAAAIEGCAQAGPERFEELGLLIAKANLASFNESIVRAFRAESVEVVSDGRDGGEARVRVHGTDDYFWLIELELLRQSLIAGGAKPLSRPFGVELTLDYVLPPDSPVLRIELRIRNLSNTPEAYQTLGAIFFGDTTELSFYSETGIQFNAFDVRMGVPWLAAESDDGSWAVALEKAFAGTVKVSGVDALVDIQQLTASEPLGPMGQDDTMQIDYLVAVGGRDQNSAVRNLYAFNREPIPDRTYRLRPLEGRALDAKAPDGNAGLAGARIGVEMQDRDGEWRRIDGFRTSSDGRFSGDIPDFGRTLRLVGRSTGSPEPEPRIFRPTETSKLDVAFERPGWLEYVITEKDRGPMPAKIMLWQDGRLAKRIFAGLDRNRIPLPAGHYEVSVTRGFEYSTHQGSLDIVKDETTVLAVALEHVVDTSGFLSVDGHMHSGPSSDSRLSMADRILSAAAEGLEVAVATDHEVVVGFDEGIEATHLEGFIASVLGQEVTATLPEHTNMYPVPRRPGSIRGDPVRWYGRDLGEIFQMERARGAGIVTLNHPRAGCGYLCLIRYDRTTGQPSLTDPTTLGFGPEQHLWTFDFDAVEYMNSIQDPFLDPSRPNETGLFEDWMSFLNLGHRITAMGVTDSHGVEDVGTPRTYFVSGTDDPGAFTEADLVRAIKEGRALVSAGGFARVRVDGASMGDDVPVEHGDVALSIQVQALPEIDVTRIVVFANCDQVDAFEADHPNARVKYDGMRRIHLERDAHLVVIGFGTTRFPRGLESFDPKRIPRFTTNAIYVDVDGNRRFDPPLGKSCQYALP